MTKNRIDTKLAQCKAEGKKALITFITAGDGGYDCTEKAVLEMVENGADLIELGVPFSDPIDRKSTRLNSSHKTESRMPSSA